MRPFGIDSLELRADLLETRLQIEQPAQRASRVDVQVGQRRRGRADGTGGGADLGVEGVEDGGGVG